MLHLTDYSPLDAAALDGAIRTLTELEPSLWVACAGYSILHRPLTYIRLGQGRPCMLYVATHHAMEWICGRILLLFAEYLIGAEPRGQAPHGTFYILPLLNPDGVELQSGGFDEKGILAERQLRANGLSRDFSLWQANARGVDLNHNYETGFYAYRAVERELGIEGGAPTRYSGAAPLSEPETRALVNLICNLVPDAVLTLHAQGREMFLGGSPAPHTALAAEVLARRSGYRVAAPEGPAAYGGLTDWLCAEGIPAMTVECGQGRNPLPPASLGALWEEVFPILYHAPRLLPLP